MTIEVLKSKIHRVTVTQANVDYVGSITIDSNLLEAANIIRGEKVQVVNVTNGERLETYAIPGEAGSGVICLNGAAARCVQIGDKVIIMAYAQLTQDEAKNHHPDVVFVNDKNRIIEIADCEIHGEIK